MKRIWMFTAVLALIAGCLALTPAAQAAPRPPADPGVPGLILDQMTGTSQVVTNFKDGSYSTSAALFCTVPVGSCDTLRVGSPSFTGVYKKLSGPGSTYHYVPVYRRTWKACRSWTGGSASVCMGGTIVYAANFAACFSGCTVAGQRGSQGCDQDEIALGMSVTLTECRNHLALTGTHAYEASVAYNTYRLCPLHLPITSCFGSTWHVNAYSTGTITGPYSGYGVA